MAQIYFLPATAFVFLTLPGHLFFSSSSQQNSWVYWGCSRRLAHSLCTPKPSQRALEPRTPKPPRATLANLCHPGAWWLPLRSCSQVTLCSAQMGEASGLHSRATDGWSHFATKWPGTWAGRAGGEGLEAGSSWMAESAWLVALGAGFRLRVGLRYTYLREKP